MRARERQTHANLIADPEAKRLAREIKDEPWIADFLVDHDPTIRRLGASLALQELRARMGLPVPSAEPMRRGRKRRVA